VEEAGRGRNCAADFKDALASRDVLQALLRWFDLNIAKR